jgi:hypothetical protein
LKEKNDEHGHEGNPASGADNDVIEIDMTDIDIDVAKLLDELESENAASER